MEIDLTGPLREDAYLILAGLVTPRPIALTTTNTIRKTLLHVRLHATL